MADVSPTAAADETSAPDDTDENANGAGPGAGVDAGTYEILRARLSQQAGELARRAEALNQQRLDVFGATEMRLVGTDRIRTENNCVPRDIVSVGGLMLFGFNVFIGLKTETTIDDVFSLHRFSIVAGGGEDGDGDDGESFRFEDAAADDLPSLLRDGQFERDFAELYRYYKDSRLLQLRRAGSKLLAVFTTSQRVEDVRVLRWEFDASGGVTYVDNRGERDHTFPPSHDFEWTSTTREQHVLGRHPHISIDDEVFIEAVGGDLTVKVEDNTEEGHGVYREPVDDPDQSLADADIRYARVGPLILFRVRPYNETEWRHLVFNTRTTDVVRLDGIGQACQRLPEDHGIIFPGGYYLSTGVHKTFDTASSGGIDDLEFTDRIRSPNGEDVLYVFHARAEGRTLLLSYNLIRKQVQNPIVCNGYSLFDDGTLVVFRSTSNEPTRVHPMQVWQTPFTSDTFAAAQPTGDSVVERVGNAELVRGVSDALSVQQMVEEMEPSTAVFEALIGATTRVFDSYHWLGDRALGDLRAPLTDVRATAEQVLDEFEKVVELRQRAERALADADAEITSLVRRVRGESPRDVDEFVSQLAELRRAQGRLVSLRELRYMDIERTETIESTITEEFDHLSGRTVEFLEGDDAFTPYHRLIDELTAEIDDLATVADAEPVGARLVEVGDGLELLTTVVGSLTISDATVRTAILERISEVLGGVNRARAMLENRRTELLSSEGRAEFSAEFTLFNQAVTGALAMADTPDRCDEQLSRLMLQLENLETRFGEFDDYLVALAEKREDVYEAFSSRKQALLDDRQRRAERMMSAATRLLDTIARRVQTLDDVDEINTYFVADPMVTKLRDLSSDLRGLGDAVRAEELDAKLKTAREDAARSLRDRQDIFESGGETIRLGQHRFAVNTQPIDLTVVPHDDELALAVTGTDFRAQIDDPVFAETAPYWNQLLVSETAEVYRAEYLAVSILTDAADGHGAHTLASLHEASVSDGGLLDVVRHSVEERFDEGYERGVHDHDAARILRALVNLHASVGLLRYPPSTRAVAQLFWAHGATERADRWSRRAASLGRMRETFGPDDALVELAAELGAAIGEFADANDLALEDRSLAGEYLFEELATETPAFATSAAGRALLDELRSSIGSTRTNARKSFENDLQALDGDLAGQVQLLDAWISAYLATQDRATQDRADEHDGPRDGERDEAIAIALCGSRIERSDSSAAVRQVVDDLLGQHPRIIDRSLTVRIDEILARVRRFRSTRVPGFRHFQHERNEYLARERHRLRIEEYRPTVMSAFVRNRLIDEVYLPVIGDNLAKQLGTTGDAKRTDQMGLLLLISPPGYGKTTLMEYVANRLGLVFVKVNGPALGHDVTSIDPDDAPNATARQEVDKINFALEMGNNVLLYVDDIQHTSSELLQKFISMTDAQRRMEGVWNGRTRTYDLRGKRFAVCMAGNPYTESGERFQVPDMLANRADTYNLGDILTGRDELFALSYIENSLTSNAVLAPLAGQSRDDLRLLVRIAAGDAGVRADQLEHSFGATELEQILSVLTKLIRIQEIVLAVNQAYIASASQDDAYRTEPPFQLQGSYRNMNKLAEKVVAVMNDDELEALIDDHYMGEAQTLTTGAEANLLKLAELRGTMTDEQQARWKQIKDGFARVQALGDDDDPMARAIGALGLLTDRVGAIGDALRETATTEVPAVADPPAPATLPIEQVERLNQTLEAVRFAAQDAAVLANPRTRYLLSMLRGVVDEVVDPLLGEMVPRAEGEEPTPVQELLDDTRVRAESLRYLLEQIDGLPGPTD